MTDPLARAGWLGVFYLPYMLTPITIATWRYDRGPYFVRFRALYVFGVRVARWQVDQGSVYG